MNQNEFNVGVLALVDQIATTLSLSAHMPTRINVRKHVREMLKDMPGAQWSSEPKPELPALELGTAVHSVLEAMGTTHKPFAGIIEKWYRNGDRISGRCAWYFDPIKSQYNGIVAGQSMHTSSVFAIKDNGSFSICETRNSIYVLLDEVK